MGEAWVVNASPVITLAKAGYLHLFDQLSPDILIPEPVIEEILAGPPSDPARKAIESSGGKLRTHSRCSFLRNSRRSPEIKHAGLIESATTVMHALRQAGLRLDDQTLRIALKQIDEGWPG